MGTAWRSARARDGRTHGGPAARGEGEHGAASVVRGRGGQRGEADVCRGVAVSWTASVSGEVQGGGGAPAGEAGMPYLDGDGALRPDREEHRNLAGRGVVGGGRGPGGDGAVALGRQFGR